MIKLFFQEIFPYEKFPVEYECYKQLVAQNDCKINYLAIPWTQILNSHWLNFPNKKDYSYYIDALMSIKIAENNNVTVCQHDDYMKLENVFKHLNIKTVFSTLHDINNKIDGIDILPISFTNNFIFNKTYKDILFSFVGAYNTHSIRQKMFDKIRGPNIIYRNTYHVDSGTINSLNYKQKQEEEYKSILERSRYSLCPRGSSPSSVRFWESLAAGTIPILISDKWMLPEWDWDNTIIKISEKEFLSLDYNDIKMRLYSIDDSMEEKMRENCLLAYENFKKENYYSYITKTYDKFYNK